MRSVPHYQNQSRRRSSHHHCHPHSLEIHMIYSIQRRVMVEQIFLSHHFPIAKIHMYLYSTKIGLQLGILIKFLIYLNLI